MTEQKLLGNLLIVDDDKIIVKLLSRIFEKYCTQKLAHSGEEAIKILKEGFKPGVIICDQIMPGMQGSEFLARSIQYVPDAKRIILTGNHDVAEIMKAITEAKAFMYLIKPFDNISLIKNVSNAFEEYNSKKNLKNKLKDYERKIELLEGRIKSLVGDHDLELEKTSVVNQLFKLAQADSKFYFRNSLSSICITSRYLAEEFDLTDQETDNLVYAAFIHGIYRIGLDEKFRLVDPPDMITGEREQFKEHFVSAFANLLDNFSLNHIAQICLKMWEKPDGSGFPDQLKENSIPLISTLLNIAVKYENLVYRLEPEKLNKLKKEGSIIQTPEETKKRHDEAVKRISKNLSYYEQKPVKAFKNLLTFGNCPTLIPQDNDLEIEL